MNEYYSYNYYENRHLYYKYSADKILDILFKYIPKPYSMIDIGCGVGTWLKIAKEKFNVKIVKGLDGKWVPLNLLEINQNEFIPINFEESLPQFKERFDLAISLEVVEHLPNFMIDKFIEYLTNLSDQILFSAAIPGQGGKNHINEQWQSFWIHKFKKLSYYVFDIIRPKIWYDSRIPFWYKQNIFLFINKNSKIYEKLILNNEINNNLIYDIVHPDLFKIKTFR